MEITNENHHHGQASFNSVGGAGGNYPFSNVNLGSGLGSGVKVNHIPRNWTPEEQAILEEGLYQYASDSAVTRYARIAMRLQHKTIHDVALRARWMNGKDIGKRRKDDQSKKNKYRREIEKDSSSKPTQAPSQPDVAPQASLDNNDDIPYKAIGGPTAELLEQNAEVFRTIAANFSALQIEDNISLFCQARDNLAKIMNGRKETPDVMRQMPPLALKLNEELASTILPSDEPSNTGLIPSSLGKNV